ncbi:hypothetical protein JOD31_001564 [Methylopila capsulata]|uniref:Uncharacterized protein n=1 Tax=Methylopila capsulata TaxID=61654 RepID=A0A9W6IRN3_9HYPH|nr:hypothetical protein [Methylopila capsulata]MBM7851339.1 hypothetical protein [Methylopila capsulata]GLK54397.1 hypothetical protein GCM10008170_04160 [Methylopila capsulata]
MPQLHSITDITEQVAEAWGVTGAALAVLHRRVRDLHAQKRIAVAAIQGGRKTALFDLREVVRAIILLALLEAGFDAKTLAEAEHWLDRAIGDGLGFPALNGTWPPVGLDALIHAVEEGQSDLDFALYVRRDVETGERFVVGRFERDGKHGYGEGDLQSLSGPDADGVEAWAIDEGGERMARYAPRLTIARVVLPASALVRPFVLLPDGD